MRLRLAIALAAAILCGALAYSAGEGTTSKVVATRPPAAASKIWSALILATNDSDPRAAPEELREFEPRLKRIFGYNQFEIIGSASNEIGDGTECWLVPSESFWFGLRARRALSKEARGGYLLTLQLFQDKRPLVDTEVKLAPGSPLFIRGPQYGAGQLVIVLQVQR